VSVTEAASAAAPAAISVSAEAKLVRLRDGRLLTPASWNRALTDVVQAVGRYAEANQLRDGIPKGELKSQLARELPGPVFEEALDVLTAAGRLTLRADRVTLPQAGPALSPRQERVVGEIERRLSEKGFQVPDVSELTRGVSSAERPDDLLRYLVDSGRAVKVTSQLLYPRGLWEELEGRLREHFRKSPTLTMGAFKDLAQVSRKYAVPMLEHLDRTGLTKRQGDDRIPGPKLQRP
jgi:selenocysteine-specific elongation factor